MKKFYFKVREVSVSYVAAYGENEDEAWEKVNDAANYDEIPNLRFQSREIDDITDAVENLIVDGRAEEKEYPVIEE